MAVSDPLTLREQAEMLDRIVARCVLRDGSLSGETTMVLDRKTADDLHHLAMRLERMAPYQENIEKLVRYGRI